MTCGVVLQAAQENHDNFNNRLAASDAATGAAAKPAASQPGTGFKFSNAASGGAGFNFEGAYACVFLCIILFKY